MESYNNGKYEEAVTLLQDFIHQYSNDARLSVVKDCLKQAKLKLSKEKEYDKREQSSQGNKIDQAIAKSKKDQVRELSMEVIHSFSSGEYEETVKLCQAMLVLDPKHEGAKSYLKKANDEIGKKGAMEHLRKGNELAKKGKALEAAAEWQLAISANPGDQQVQKQVELAKINFTLEHNNKATNYLSEDKVFEAIAEWDIVLAVNPYNDTAKKGLELANYKMKNLKQEERTNLSYSSLMQKANEAFEIKDYLGAVELYKQALNEKRSDVTATQK